ncbi:hypothetical protein ACRRTK_009095 [Alexandromys fortis]
MSRIFISSVEPSCHMRSYHKDCRLGWSLFCAFISQSCRILDPQGVMCLPKGALSWKLNASSTVPAFIRPPLQADGGMTGGPTYSAWCLSPFSAHQAFFGSF